MAKTDRAVLTTNNQTSGQIGDPDKLEASITHAYDKIDANDDEFITHKTAVTLDHPDGSVTNAKLAASAVTNAKIATGTITADRLVIGTLDTRYYTETEIDNKFSSTAGGQSYSFRSGLTFPTTPIEHDVFVLTADQTISGVVYKAKKAYQYLNGKWEEFLNGANINTQTASLVHGLQNIYSDQSTLAHLKKLLGRTLVNHMGRQGGFYSQFNRWDANLTIDTAVYKFGTSSGKIDNSAGTTPKNSENSQKLNLKGKYILLGVWAKAVSGTPNIDAHILERDASNVILADNVLDTVVDATWKFYYRKFNLTASASDHCIVRLDVDTYGTANDVINFDGLVIYELTSAEYSRVHTQAEIEEQYAYANSVKPIMNPMFTAYGKQLLPPFTEWTLHANAEVVSPYELSHTANGTLMVNNSPKIPILPNQNYTLSATVSPSNVDVQMDVQVYDKNGSLVLDSADIVTTTTSVTFTTPSTADYVQVRAYIQSGATAGTFTFTNPQLELGSVATAFVANNNDYAYIQGSFHSNLDGTVADVLTQVSATEWDVVQKFKDVVLDGTLAWEFSTDYTGYKVVKAAVMDTNYKYAKSNATKYDGKILLHKTDFDTASWTAGDQYIAGYNNNYVFISLPDTDTGWLEAWTGTELTQNWIKSNFNGWKYTGDGTTHSWVSKYDSSATSTDFNYVIANRASGMTDANAYLLNYQRATEVSEPITVEGALNFHQYDNQVELAEGVIVRELNTPYLSSGYYYINSVSNNKLKHRTDVIVKVYKNGKVDTKWTIAQRADGNIGIPDYGKGYAQIPEADFDPTAQYTVTYTLLDKHEHTVNAMSADVSYQTNLKTVVDQLVVDQTDTQTKVTEIEGDIERRLLKGEGERVESGSNSLSVATAGTAVTVSITFKQQYAKPPKRIRLDLTAVAGSAGYINAWATNITKSGFTLNVNAYLAGSYTVGWDSFGN
jgi:hypothetical protein